MSAVEIARKQRHLYLLQKVKGNRPLTAGELEELKKYEQMPRTTGKKIVKGKKRQ